MKPHGRNENERHRHREDNYQPGSHRSRADRSARAGGLLLQPHRPHPHCNQEPAGDAYRRSKSERCPPHARAWPPGVLAARSRGRAQIKDEGAHPSAGTRAHRGRCVPGARARNHRIHSGARRTECEPGSQGRVGGSDPLRKGIRTMSNMNRTMREAMRLMQAGDLHAATQAIQRGLRGGAEPAYAATAPAEASPSARCIEGQYRVVADSPSEAVQRPAITERTEHLRSNRRDGEFRHHRFACDAGTMHYKLFIPAGLATTRSPLIVMLHGCTQSPDDFACGTRMNALAQEHGYVVAYPAQARSNNASKCWNWFRSYDQQRGQGEPAIIAALTRHVVNTHNLDERRVYIAGLSAGGAMAVVLASTYPDVYAAIGVHSGLPFGLAHDLPSAFAAMKQGADAAFAHARPAPIDPVPAIVFHGDRDTTVDPCNGAAVIDQCTGTKGSVDHGESAAARATVEHGSVPGGRTYTRTIFRNADGSVAAEQWVVHGAGHAWFGGDPAGSFTDPSGPDASEHMLRFFSACARSAIN